MWRTAMGLTGTASRCMNDCCTLNSFLFVCRKSNRFVICHRECWLLEVECKVSCVYISFLLVLKIRVGIKCVSGHFVPPLVVFPRKNINNHLMKEVSPGTVGVFQPLGWIQSNMFINSFLHFAEKWNRQTKVFDTFISGVSFRWPLSQLEKIIYRLCHCHRIAHISSNLRVKSLLVL